MFLKLPYIFALEANKFQKQPVVYMEISSS